MSKLRIAVAGAGLIGRRHIEEIVASASCTLSAIVDPSPHASVIARQHGVAHCDALRELLARHKPDGIVLATPNAMHVDQALECIAAGVPVLVEKPIAHTPEAGERLVEAAERANHKLLVGHHRLHSPVLQKAVQTVRSGALGRIVGVIGSAVFYKPDADGYFDGPNAWRRRPGGGPILINMTHEIGNLRALVGEIVAVQAFASAAIRGFEVEDTVAVNLRFANGALGTFLLSDTAASPKSWEQTSQENRAYASYPDEDCYTVVGTRGSLGVPTMRLLTYASDRERSWFEPFVDRTIAVGRADPLALQVEHFAAVIRGEAAPRVAARDALMNVRVTDAIVQAARTAGSVDVASN
jgi:predicted dehydrogenase